MPKPNDGFSSFFSAAPKLNEGIALASVVAPPVGLSSIFAVGCPNDKAGVDSAGVLSAFLSEADPNENAGLSFFSSAEPNESAGFASSFFLAGGAPNEKVGLSSFFSDDDANENDGLSFAASSALGGAKLNVGVSFFSPAAVLPNAKAGGWLVGAAVDVSLVAGGPNEKDGAGFSLSLDDPLLVVPNEKGAAFGASFSLLVVDLSFSAGGAPNEKAGFFVAGVSSDLSPDDERAPKENDGVDDDASAFNDGLLNENGAAAAFNCDAGRLAAGSSSSRSRFLSLAVSVVG